MIRVRHRCTGGLDICQERVGLRLWLRGRDRLHVPRLACIRIRGVRFRFARRASMAAPRETSRPPTSLALLRHGDASPLAQVACRSRCPAAELPPSWIIIIIHEKLPLIASDECGLMQMKLRELSRPTIAVGPASGQRRQDQRHRSHQRHYCPTERGYLVEPAKGLSHTKHSQQRAQQAGL
jgi:hypothetical protein